MNLIALTVGIVGITVILFAPMQYGYTVMLLSAFFTRMSFFNESKILVYEVLVSVFLLKLLFVTGKVYIKVPILLLLFFLYAAVSILFALLYTDVYVLNPNGIYAPISFSVQQITQFLYLAVSIVFMTLTSHMLSIGKITAKGVLNRIDVAYSAVALLGISQLFVDTDVFSKIFKNSGIAIQSQQIFYGQNQLYRIDSTFGEPSMLALFLTPIMCMHLYRVLVGRGKMKDIVISIVGVLICLENQSSSSLVGLIIMFVCLLILIFHNIYIGKIKTTQKHLLFFAFSFTAICIGVFLMKDYFLEMFNTFAKKMQQNNLSGIERARWANIHWNVFKEHFLFGVGFGTLRSTDLITGWLAEMGIIGFGFYLFYVISICRRLWRNKSPLATELMIGIIIHNGIMMISVPEFMIVSVWIYYAIAEYLTTHREIGNLPD